MLQHCATGEALRLSHLRKALNPGVSVGPLACISGRHLGSGVLYTGASPAEDPFRIPNPICMGWKSKRKIGLDCPIVKRKESKNLLLRLMGGHWGGCIAFTRAAPDR